MSPVDTGVILFWISIVTKIKEFHYFFYLLHFRNPSETVLEPDVVKSTTLKEIRLLTTGLINVILYYAIAELTRD